jgi:hypothetical protein
MITDLVDFTADSKTNDELSESYLTAEIDLHKLIYKNLERDGLISRLKAQLRAAVFSTIEKASSSTSTNPTSSFYDDATQHICHGIVLDWLENSQLLFTEDVLKAEIAGSSHSRPPTRAELFEQLRITQMVNTGQPILHILLSQHAYEVSIRLCIRNQRNINQTLDFLVYIFCRIIVQSH